MQLNQWLLVMIVVLPLGLVFAGRLRMDLAALLMAVLLGIFQLSGMNMLGPANSPHDAIKAISGFSQSVVITLISLFILTGGLEKSGLARWLARQMVRFGGNHPDRLITLFAAFTAFLSLFMNNLAAGALVLPSAMEASRRTGVKPSKLLIPIAYGSLLGGAATYFTTANILVSDLLRIANPPQAALNILDFTPTGGLVALAGILFLWLFGDRLLPDREPAAEQALARRTGSDLEDIYQIGERLWEIRVQPESPLIGKNLTESEIGKNWGVSVVAIQRARDHFAVATFDSAIMNQDLLLIIGREEKIVKLAALGLEIHPAGPKAYLSPHGIAFAEVLLAPHSSIVGRTLRNVDFRQRYQLSVIALKRGTRSYRTDVGDIPLAFGDSMLVVGQAAHYQSLRRSPDFILIEPSLSDQPVNLRQALVISAFLLAAIVASAAGAPVYLCMLAGAVLTLLLNIVSMEEAYQSIEWQAIFLIAGMYAVSLAMVQTGLAAQLGQAMTAAVTHFGPLAVAAGAYLLSALLSQVMGGQVTALVVGPITISAAIATGANTQAVAVATAIGCSASFLTPMAHPVNVLMIAPANYTFSDFFRIGWPLTLLSFAMLLTGIFLFWKI